jgi:hypothetical protein
MTLARPATCPLHRLTGPPSARGVGASALVGIFTPAVAAAQKG